MMETPKAQTVCYVLTSDGQDEYADMNLISVWSVRTSNPQVKIVVLGDSRTLRSLEMGQHPLLTEIDEFKVVDVPTESANFTNRYIKTSVRRWMVGPFLFLDGDTLVRGDLTPVFQTKAAVAGVGNHSGGGHPSEMPETERVIFANMGWDLPVNHYVNGGVLFFTEHPDAYLFCDLWHRLWLDCSARTGRHFDQVPLNRALADSSVQFAWLAPRFNAQVHARPACAWGAAIWHIYLSGHHPTPRNVLSDCIQRMRSDRPVNRLLVGAACQRNHPWLVSSPVDWYAVAGFRRHHGLVTGTEWSLLWLAGEHMKAIRRCRMTLRECLMAIRRSLGIRSRMRDCACRLLRTQKSANPEKTHK
jgi:hypothetical protein